MSRKSWGWACFCSSSRSHFLFVVALMLQILAHFAIASAAAYKVQNSNTQFATIVGRGTRCPKSAKLAAGWATGLPGTLARPLRASAHSGPSHSRQNEAPPPPGKESFGELRTVVGRSARANFTC